MAARPTTELQIQLEKQFFKKGAAVEVSSDDVDFRGAWFTAKVIGPVNKKTRTLYVEYDTLVREDNTSKLLREHVDALLVRPPAPRETSRKFKLDEEVNAFHNDAWWEGKINGTVTGDHRFSVYFKNSREEIEFAPSDLRLHREWDRGVWVPPLEEEDGKDKNAAGASSSYKY